jgi:hypothetical protein
MALYCRGIRPLDPSGTKEQRSRLVDALTTNLSGLLNISDDFRSIARKYVIASFYELHMWPGINYRIVDASSALMTLEHEEQIPMKAAHSGIYQFKGENDPLFEKTLACIEEAAEGMKRETGLKDGTVTTSVELHLIKTRGR